MKTAPEEGHSGSGVPEGRKVGKVATATTPGDTSRITRLSWEDLCPTRGSDSPRHSEHQTQAPSSRDHRVGEPGLPRDTTRPGRAGRPPQGEGPGRRKVADDGPRSMSASNPWNP